MRWRIILVGILIKSKSKNEIYEKYNHFPFGLFDEAGSSSSYMHISRNGAVTLYSNRNL